MTEMSRSHQSIQGQFCHTKAPKRPPSGLYGGGPEWLPQLRSRAGRRGLSWGMDAARSNLIDFPHASVQIRAQAPWAHRPPEEASQRLTLSSPPATVAMRHVAPIPVLLGRTPAPPVPSAAKAMTADTWILSEPPTDREFLALAVAAGTLNSPVVVVARWNELAKGWQPVKVPGDTITEITLNIVCWTELPEPAVIG